MGADAFISFFGIKIPLDPDDEETLDAVGEDVDPRCKRAMMAGLHTHSGRMTDGEDYFLYIGQRLAWLGIEHDSHIELSGEQIAAMQANVRTKLVEAGFQQTPAFHFQLHAQY